MNLTAKVDPQECLLPKTKKGNWNKMGTMRSCEGLLRSRLDMDSGAQRRQLMVGEPRAFS